MFSEKMTASEKRSVISLSSIMSLRMMGLFMVLPVFSLYAQSLPGATPLLMGLAMGIYGLSQALLQIPFGSLSDRLGRKPIMLVGLLLFAAGSLLSALAPSITLLIMGRTLQGMGAIGGTTLALMADLTREDQRTKAMAVAGISIGFSFSLAMLLGPLLTPWMGVNGLFLLAAVLGLIAILCLYTIVPTPHATHWHRDTEPELASFLSLLMNKELAKLNGGIFILHAIFTASFVVVPLSLAHFSGFTLHDQWMLYLPILMVAFILCLAVISLAEKKRQLKPYFLASIVTLILAEGCLSLTSFHLIWAILGLCLFFAGFSVLEAFLPSLISRTAPVDRKGSALGLYSCAQFLGIFVGGVLGGWLYGKFSFSGVYFFCIMLALSWLALAFFMQPPPYLITQMWRLASLQPGQWESLAQELRSIPGMVEVIFIVEDSMAYLKMKPETLHHPDFIRLKEHHLATV